MHVTIKVSTDKFPGCNVLAMMVGSEHTLGVHKGFTFLLASSHLGPWYPAWQLQVLLPTQVPFRQGGSQIAIEKQQQR